MIKHAGPWRQRDMVPSKGERLFKRIHGAHKPGGGLPYRPRPVKVVRMFKALMENGWKFVFKVEATSPRGYPYRGEGATPEKAFLNAFRLYQNDLVTFVPKIPSVVKAAQVTPKPEPPKVKRTWNRFLGDVIPKRVRSDAPEYMRYYMRARRWRGKYRPTPVDIIQPERSIRAWERDRVEAA